MSIMNLEDSDKFCLFRFDVSFVFSFVRCKISIHFVCLGLMKLLFSVLLCLLFGVDFVLAWFQSK